VAASIDIDGQREGVAVFLAGEQIKRHQRRIAPRLREKLWAAQKRETGAYRPDDKKSAGESDRNCGSKKWGRYLYVIGKKLPLFFAFGGAMKGGKWPSSKKDLTKGGGVCRGGGHMKSKKTSNSKNHRGDQHCKKGDELRRGDTNNGGEKR